ncbi:MAG: polyphosphate--glucose phosphotransferase [Beutenbergiaceae bacterium]
MMHVDYAPGTLGFGIDIGGSGIKGAPVDLLAGELAGERFRVPTPTPSTPDAVAGCLEQVLTHFQVPTSTHVGITFPGIIQHGVVRSAANLDKSWLDVDLAELVQRTTGHQATIVNDADAAGFAEVHYGAAKGRTGVVLVLTLGTGIGSALINRGQLVPNTELGHLEIDGYDAETRAASSVKDNEGLTYKQWSKRLQRYFEVVEFLFSPDLFVVGGGVSKDHHKFLPRITTRAPIVPAALRNQAGIVGAALLADSEPTQPQR